jgi:hypothetical protein
MKRYLPGIFLLTIFLAPNAVAQYDDSQEEVLPVGAQGCDLPAVPAKTPGDADYEALVAAQGDVKKFQQELEFYRKCLDKYDGSPDLTPGNIRAMAAAHNYSVDLEEQVAANFNEAVRTYKDSQKNPQN